MIEQARSFVKAADDLKRAENRLSNFQNGRERFVRWSNPTGSGSGYDSEPITPEIEEIITAVLSARIEAAKTDVADSAEALRDAAREVGKQC